MGLLKKFFCIIILFILLAAFFPLSSRAASTDIDIDFTKNAQTIFDVEDYYGRLQDTYINFIYKNNNTLFNAIVNQFNNHNFFYITLSTDFTKNDIYNFKIYFYDIGYPNNLQHAFTNNQIFEDSFIYNSLDQIGSIFRIRQYIYDQRIEFTYSVNNGINTWDYYSSGNITIPMCLVGRVSDYFLRLVDGGGSNGGSNSNDYSYILNTISSSLDSLYYNTNTILGDLANVKNYTNYINNKLTTTNTYLSNIQGAINNGSSTIANTIVSTHNLDNSNNNKNTNEIIDAINDNTNAISDIQVTNDNSDLINAINYGFSGLNSNINNNTNEIVSTINNASEEVVNGNNNNTNTIVSNSNSNTNDIVEAIESNSPSGGTGGITNSEFNQGVTSINDNNDYNTNRILDNQVTEEDADIFSNIDVPEFEDPLPNLSNTLNNFFNRITNSNIPSKSFSLPFKDTHINFTLDYNTLYDNFFSKNTTFYNLYKALWWGLVGFFVYKKIRIFYNKCIAGEWDEVVTAFDDSDEVIGRSIK